MSETLSAEDVRSLLATTDPLDIGLEARLIRSLDAATRRAEQAESAVGPLTREIIEDRTMFLWGELDDGKGERWLQHDGAGNAWTPMPEVFELLALVTGDEYRDAALHTADRPQSTRPRRR